MRQGEQFTLAVASGKGGTGKTLVSSNLAALAAAQGIRVALVDCDVEAPNDHLFFSASAADTAVVETIVAEVDAETCTACGACRDACAYGAVRVLGPSALVFDELCHGCGLCPTVCTTGAMHEVVRRVGEVEVSSLDGHDGLTLVTGRLDVGQVKSPWVIRSARQAASQLDCELVVLDAPPGVACSAVAAVRGADALLLVTEPTPFGLHDLELTLRLGHSMGLPMGVLVNRSTGTAEQIDAISARWGATVVGHLPFDRAIAEIYARGGLAAEELPDVRDVLSTVIEYMQRLAVGAVARR